MNKDVSSLRAVTPTAAARRLEALLRAMQNQCWSDGVHPAQWAALRFFARAPEERCTVNGLAKAQGTNPGTASRTIAALTRKGLLAVRRRDSDHRYKVITVTEEGTALLNADPLLRVEDGLAALSAEDLVVFVRSCEDLEARFQPQPL